MGARVTWHGDAAKESVRLGARAGIVAASADILDASLAVVPRESGALADAGGTDLADFAAVGSVYYDDVRDVKTIMQHEDLTYRHPAGETSKFLERPVRAARGQFAAALAREIARRLR